MTGVQQRPEPPAQSGTSQAPRGCGGTIACVLWIGVGTLAICTTLIAISPEPALGIGAREGVLALLVLATVVARSVDITHLGGRAADGEPANLTTLAGYGVALVVVALAVWGLVQQLGR